MEPNMFYEWEDYTSTYKLSRQRPRPCLQQMVEVVFQRGSTNMKYRNTFSNDEFEEVNFITAKILKSGQLPDPTPVLQPNGIDSTWKENIVKCQGKIMPGEKSSLNSSFKSSFDEFFSSSFTNLEFFYLFS
ncbi:hypothetical protein GE061_015300 [Apolygus lucorum]|uniref:Uncharacterized protein n=1 Tax=Apolygus lucorum TaxID=248454 RepID=A0A8S9XKK8_APOLU|nr:hypothetical protein GE061_015300 [Apolygus lucorum]